MIFDAAIASRNLKVEVKGKDKDGKYLVLIDGKPHEVDFRETGRDFASLLLDGKSFEAGLERKPNGFLVHLPADTLEVELTESTRGAAAGHRKTNGPSKVTAPMPGKIVRVLVEPGVEVLSGQGLVVMEAMKMENELRAPRSGRVASLPAREGQTVETGALLVVLE